MAVKKKKKTVARKKVKKEKVVVKTKKGKKLGGTTVICQLLVERKYTDEQIFEKVLKDYPSIKKAYISIQRSDINAGRKAKFPVGKNLITKIGGNKVAPKNPKATKATKAKKKNAKKKTK